MAYQPVLTSHVNEPNSYTLDFYTKNLRGYEGLRKELGLDAGGGEAPAERQDR